MGAQLSDGLSDGRSGAKRSVGVGSETPTSGYTEASQYTRLGRMTSWGRHSGSASPWNDVIYTHSGYPKVYDLTRHQHKFWLPRLSIFYVPETFELQTCLITVNLRC